MVDLTSLLTGPGELLADLFLPDSVPGDDEVRADLAVTLGVVFWLVMLLVAYKTWRVVFSQSPRAGRRGWRVTGDEVREVAQHISSLLRSRGWTWRIVWGAAIRAEFAHIVVYAGIPALWEMARLTLLILFLPFSMMSFGDQNRGWYDGTLDHMARPVCWTFVTFCPGPYSHFLHTPVVDASKCWGGGGVPYGCPRGDVRVRDTGGWYSKLAWAALALTWIALWRRRQRRSLT